MCMHFGPRPDKLPLNEFIFSFCPQKSFPFLQSNSKYFVNCQQQITIIMHQLRQMTAYISGRVSNSAWKRLFSTIAQRLHGMHFKLFVRVHDFSHLHTKQYSRCSSKPWRSTNETPTIALRLYALVCCATFFISTLYSKIAANISF